MFEFCNSNQSAESVKHGHWIGVGAFFKCSVCLQMSCCNEKYCNMCGAKMDEVIP